VKSCRIQAGRSRRAPDVISAGNTRHKRELIIFTKLCVLIDIFIDFLNSGVNLVIVQ
jgi:hypothetical protein